MQTNETSQERLNNEPGDEDDWEDDEVEIFPESLFTHQHPKTDEVNAALSAVIVRTCGNLDPNWESCSMLYYHPMFDDEGESSCIARVEMHCPTGRREMAVQTIADAAGDELINQALEVASWNETHVMSVKNPAHVPALIVGRTHVLVRDDGRIHHGVVFGLDEAGSEFEVFIITFQGADDPPRRMIGKRKTYPISAFVPRYDDGVAVGLPGAKEGMPGEGDALFNGYEPEEYVLNPDTDGSGEWLGTLAHALYRAALARMAHGERATYQEDERLATEHIHHTKCPDCLWEHYNHETSEEEINFGSSRKLKLGPDE